MILQRLVSHSCLATGPAVSYATGTGHWLTVVTVEMRQRLCRLRPSLALVELRQGLEWPVSAAT
jgi:hypothetical protein